MNKDHCNWKSPTLYYRMLFVLQNLTCNLVVNLVGEIGIADGICSIVSEFIVTIKTIRTWFVTAIMDNIRIHKHA